MTKGSVNSKKNAHSSIPMLSVVIKTAGTRLVTKDTPKSVDTETNVGGELPANIATNNLKTKF